MVKNKPIKKQNKERYHGPLLTQGVDVSAIRVFPIISLFLSLFMFMFALFNDEIGILKLVTILFVVMNGFSIIFSLFRKLVYKNVGMSYILLGINLLILLLDLGLLATLLFIGAGEEKPDIYSTIANMYMLLLTILFIAMLFVYSYFYRRDSRTNGAYRSKEAKFNSWDNPLFRRIPSNFWLILGLVFTVPSLLTGHLQNLFGFVLGILLTATFPAVIVDAVHAALYEWKS